MVNTSFMTGLSNSSSIFNDDDDDYYSTMDNDVHHLRRGRARARHHFTKPPTPFQPPRTTKPPLHPKAHLNASFTSTPNGGGFYSPSSSSHIAGKHSHVHLSGTPLANITNRINAQYSTPVSSNAGSELMWGTPLFSPLKSPRNIGSGRRSMLRPGNQYYTRSPALHLMSPVTSPISLADTSAMTAMSNVSNVTGMTDMSITGKLFRAIPRGPATSFMHLITWSNPRHTWAAIVSMLAIYSLFRVLHFDWPMSCVILAVFSVVTAALYFYARLRQQSQTGAVGSFDRNQFEYQVFRLVRPLGALAEEYYTIINGGLNVDDLAGWKLVILLTALWLLILCRLFIAEWDTIALVLSLATLTIPKFVLKSWDGFIGPMSPMPTPNTAINNASASAAAARNAHNILDAAEDEEEDVLNGDEDME